MLHRRALKTSFICLFFLATINSSTTEAKPKLTDFAYNTYSQWGEDGIIEKIFNIIGTTSKIAVEFGAHDGFYCSNTALLWSTQDWNGILIEGDPNKVQRLRHNVAPYNCLVIQEYVGIDNKNNLDALLKKHNVPINIDLISIDIDSNDYYVFESIQLRPRVFIVEHNPTLPATLDLYQPYDSTFSNHGYGCSVAALDRIAKTKGYSLICITDTNVFFVQNELFPLFKDYETSLREIQCETHLKYLALSYWGEYMLVGKQKEFSYNFSIPAQTNMLKGSAHLLQANNLFH